MFYILSFLWLIRESKAIFFWFYLWQLKEYHLGRFFDHFRTDKGKKLFLNPVIFFKIALFFYALFLSRSAKLLPWQLYASWISVLIILYLFESVKFFQDLFQKTFKKPVLTKKTLILISAALIFEILFLFVLFQKIELFYWFAFLLLSFDILTPFIASIIVFLVQPFTVIFFRNKIIKRAKPRRAEFKNLLVVGICGSYGKTSTKEFLAEILSEKYKVLKTKEHQNSEVGISLCILNDLKPEHEIFICETGAYNRGGIKLLSEISQPKIGIVTGVNEQHLSTFGSMENLISAEGGKELIESLPEDGLVIFNGNNKYCQELYQEIKKPKNKKICYNTFSTIVENVLDKDIWAEGIKVGRKSLSFKLFSKGGDSANFKVNLLGAQNVENILLAACCAKELGITLKKISKACRKLKPLPHQMELREGVGGVNIIDATYSANPEGVISHLEYLKAWERKTLRQGHSAELSRSPQCKKIIIMPCLIELGASTIEVHKRIGQKIGEVCDLAIIITKERFREIKEGAIEKGMLKNNIFFLENPKVILEKIRPYLKSENVILLEGRVPQKLINVLLEKQKNVSKS